MDEWEIKTMEVMVGVSLAAGCMLPPGGRSCCLHRKRKGGGPALSLDWAALFVVVFTLVDLFFTTAPSWSVYHARLCT